MNSKKLLIALWGGYVCFLIFWMIRFWNHFPAMMDTMEYVFPEKWFNVESFQKGLIPLWNPYIACGTPHLASFQPAVFYPPFWIWNWTGLTHWFFVLALGHVLLAAMGFYFWLKSLKVQKGMATLCALGFSGSAYLTLLWGFPTHLASLTWIPWIFWGSRRLIDDFSLGRWLGLISFWTLQILAGYPIFSFYAFLFWMIYLIAEMGWTRQWGALFLTTGGCVLLLTACQWLPFFDFLGYMHRTVWGSNLYNLRWSEYRTFFQPDILGVPGTSTYQGDYGNFIFGNFYLGLIPLFVLIWSFWRDKGKLNFWQKSLIFWLFWPLGVHLGVWNFLSTPLLDKLEVSKSSFLFIFCAFTVLGIYLNDFFSRKKNKKNWILKRVWIFVLIWILDLIFVPLRVIHLVPDPYQDAGVIAFAHKIKKMVGDGRIVSLRFGDQAYSAAVTDYATSFRETALQLVQNTNVVWGIESAQGHLTTVVDGYQNLTQYLDKGFPYNGRVLDAAGVRLILTQKMLPAFKYRLSEPVGKTNIVQNVGSMDWDWETIGEKIFPHRADCFSNLLNPKVFLENVCDLDQNPEGEITSLAPISQWGNDAFNSPCSFRFRITPRAAKYFILDQCFAPGWHAWVDGSPTPILRADGLWMAVQLSGDEGHEVLFQYSPLAFRLGLFISLVGLSAFVGLGLKRGFKV